MINYSIIIPHYNIPQLLQRCLDSIPQRKDLEIIVVDDNSNDSIVDFENFPGKNRSDITYIFNKENKGAGFSRNMAISLAKGKWILCVDADDFLLPDAFIHLAKYINEEQDVIIFKAESCLSNDVSKKGKREYAHRLNNLIDKCINKEITTTDILFEIMSPWCKLVRNSFLKKHNIKFDLTTVSEDVMWSTQLAVYAKKCTISENYIYCLTEREGSLSNTITLNNTLIWYDIIKRKNLYLSNLGIIDRKEYFSYNDLSIIRCSNKIIYIKYIFKSIQDKLLKPINFYKIETTLNFKYPYLYLLLGVFDYPSLNRFPIIKHIWKRLC